MTRALWRMGGQIWRSRGHLSRKEHEFTLKGHGNAIAEPLVERKNGRIILKTIGD